MKARRFAEDPEFLEKVSMLSGLLVPYGLVPDSAVIDEGYNMTLSFGDTKILLGTDLFLEEKIARLDAILPDIQGTTGILHMEDYTEGSKDIIFETL